MGGLPPDPLPLPRDGRPPLPSPLRPPPLASPPRPLAPLPRPLPRGGGWWTLRGRGSLGAGGKPRALLVRSSTRRMRSIAPSRASKERDWPIRKNRSHEKGSRRRFSNARQRLMPVKVWPSVLSWSPMSKAHLSRVHPWHLHEKIGETKDKYTNK